MIDLLIMLLVFIVVFALVSYIVNNYLPVEPGLKQLILLVLGVVFLIWILLALFGTAPGFHFGRTLR